MNDELLKTLEENMMNKTSENYTQKLIYNRLVRSTGSKKGRDKNKEKEKEIKEILNVDI